MNNMMYSSFPVHMLPEAFQDPLRETVAIVQSPPEMVFSSMLPVAAVACQGLIDVQRKERLVGPVSINTNVVSSSGARKSAIDSKLTVPLKEFDRLQREKHQNACIHYEADFKAWQTREKAVCDQIRKAERDGEDVTELTQRHKQLYLNKPTKPTLRRILIKDTTVAGLQKALSGNAASIGLFAPEAGDLINGRTFSDRGLWNEIWDGGIIQVDRANKTFVIEDARASMSIMIQPGLFDKFMKNKGSESRESGFWSRFFITRPPSWEGIRFEDGYTPEPIKLQRFYDRVTALLNAHTEAGDAGNHKRETLKFTPEAQSEWFTIFNGIETQMSILGALHAVKDYAAKYADNLARVAAIFHYFQGKTGAIDLNTLYQANAICQWYLEEFRKIFTPSPMLYIPPQDATDAQALEKWLIKYFINNGVYWINKTHLMRHGSVRGVNRLMPALHILFQKRILAPRPPIQHPGRKPLVTYDLNPAFFNEAARQQGFSPD